MMRKVAGAGVCSCAAGGPALWHGHLQKPLRPGGHWVDLCSHSKGWGSKDQALLRRKQTEPRKPAKGATTSVGRQGGETWLEREEVLRRPPPPESSVVRKSPSRDVCEQLCIQHSVKTLDRRRPEPPFQTTSRRRPRRPGPCSRGWSAPGPGRPAPSGTRGRGRLPAWCPAPAGAGWGAPPTPWLCSS